MALLNFLTFWNEYLFSPSILGIDAAVRTVKVAVPALVIYLLLQGRWRRPWSPGIA